VVEVVVVVVVVVVLGRASLLLGTRMREVVGLRARRLESAAALEQGPVGWGRGLRLGWGWGLSLRIRTGTFASLKSTGTGVSHGR
jgi:hypothetical protein